MTTPNANRRGEHNVKAHWVAALLLSVGAAVAQAAALTPQEIDKQIARGAKALTFRDAPAYLVVGSLQGDVTLLRSEQMKLADNNYVVLARSCRPWIAAISFAATMDGKVFDRSRVDSVCKDADFLEVAVAVSGAKDFLLAPPVDGNLNALVPVPLNPITAVFVELDGQRISTLPAPSIGTGNLSVITNETSGIKAAKKIRVVVTIGSSYQRSVDLPYETKLALFGR